MSQPPLIAKIVAVATAAARGKEHGGAMPEVAARSNGAISGQRDAAAWHHSIAVSRDAMIQK
jgi:hypothetical protein